MPKEIQWEKAYYISTGHYYEDEPPHVAVMEWRETATMVIWRQEGKPHTEERRVNNYSQSHPRNKWSATPEEAWERRTQSLERMVRDVEERLKIATEKYRAHLEAHNTWLEGNIERLPAAVQDV